MATESTQSVYVDCVIQSEAPEHASKWTLCLHGQESTVKLKNFYNLTTTFTILNQIDMVAENEKHTSTTH